jgi:hypothetical protein
MTTSSPRKIIIACRDANGSPDMFLTIVNATNIECENGEHYDRAEKIAEEQGYEGPFISYDESEQNNITRQIPELNAPIKVKLSHKGDKVKEPVDAFILIRDGEISIKFKGYNQCESSDTGFDVAWLEYYNESLKLHTYTDINTDNPTHNICFDGAENDKLGLLNEDKPIGLEKALDELEDNDENYLWEVEVGLFDLENDPNTAFDIHTVWVAAEDKEEANEKAQELAENTIYIPIKAVADQNI